MAGVLHEDLEPRNVVWGPVGPTIIDFSHSSLHDCAGPGKCEELVQAYTDIWRGHGDSYWWVGALVKWLADIGRRVYRLAS